MDFALSKELEMLRKAVREFATKKIAPNADQWDEEHHFPYKEAILPMGELGFFGTVIPEAYGGEEMDWLAAMIVTEEIARANSSLRIQINMQTLGCAFTIYKYGSEELRKKYIPKLVSAEYIGGTCWLSPRKLSSTSRHCAASSFGTVAVSCSAPVASPVSVRLPSFAVTR